MLVDSLLGHIFAHDAQPPLLVAARHGYCFQNSLIAYLDEVDYGRRGVNKQEGSANNTLKVT